MFPNGAGEKDEIRMAAFDSGHPFHEFLQQAIYKNIVLKKEPAVIQ